MLTTLLLAVAFGLVGYLHIRLNKLHKAFETQGNINKVQKQAYDTLVSMVRELSSELEEVKGS